MIKKYNSLKICKSIFVILLLLLIFLAGDFALQQFFARGDIGNIVPNSGKTWISDSSTMQQPAGEGTTASPYQIYNAKELAYVASKNPLTVVISICQNIDLNSHLWQPFLNESSGSKITIEGNNYTIFNMKVRYVTQQEDAGLISFYETVTITNLSLANVDVVGYRYTGGFIGYTFHPNMNNCSVTGGTIIGNHFVGGIIGYEDDKLSTSNKGILNNLFNNASVSSENYGEYDFTAAGGIIGGLRNGTRLKNSINYGTVSGYSNLYNNYIGGICGAALWNTSLTNVLAECNLYGVESSIGGLVGYAHWNLVLESSGFHGNIFYTHQVGVETKYSQAGYFTGIGSILGNNSLYSDGATVISNCFGIADVRLYNCLEDCVWPLGAPIDGNYVKVGASTYSNSLISYNKERTENYRNYQLGQAETHPFMQFTYNNFTNGGFPFPKGMFAIGQYLPDVNVETYLKSYDFRKSPYTYWFDSNNNPYIVMGRYPQSFVGSTLNAALEEWYNAKPIVGQYSIDNGSSGTNTYNAYQYKDGLVYVRMPSTKLYSSTYTFLDGTSVYSGVAWFKVEPIYWYITNYNAMLSGEKPVVVSQIALFSDMCWNKSSSDGNLWYNTCNARAYLNNTFFQQAFSPMNRVTIQRQITKNSNSDTGVDTGGKDTEDSVWLPSYAEYKTYSDAVKLCSPSDFALARYCDMATSYTSLYRKGTCNWYLRSPYASTSVRVGAYYGGITNDANIVKYLGIRPAVTLQF